MAAVMARWSSGGVEPAPAIYEPSARELLEALAAGAGSLQPLADEATVVVARPPSSLRSSWTSIDTVEQLQRIRHERRS